jgi:hypothetical protein
MNPELSPGPYLGPYEPIWGPILCYTHVSSDKHAIDQLPYISYTVLYIYIYIYIEREREREREREKYIERERGRERERERREMYKERDVSMLICLCNFGLVGALVVVHCS